MFGRNELLLCFIELILRGIFSSFTKKHKKSFRIRLVINGLVVLVFQSYLIDNQTNIIYPRSNVE